MTEETKSKVFDTLKNAFPQDLSIAEVSRLTGVSEPTGAMYIRILEAEGKVEYTRIVGRSKMFQYKAET